MSRVSTQGHHPRGGRPLGSLVRSPEVAGSGLRVPLLLPIPRTSGLLPDLILVPFLCKMGLAVIASFHERQYCITNESLGPNEAKTCALRSPPRLRKEHLSGWQRDRGRECSDFVFELAWPLGGYPGISDLHLHQDSFLAHLFRVGKFYKWILWAFFRCLIPATGLLFSWHIMRQNRVKLGASW